MGKDQNIIRYYKNRAKKNVLDSRFIGINENGIEYKIYNNLENRYKTIIKNHKLNINGKDLIGCTFNELKKYISKLLINDMTFRNYGEWEIDHIFPLSKINYLDINENKKYFNYKNLQPLWKTENRHKYNKTECEHSELGEANGEIIENNFVVL